MSETFLERLPCKLTDGEVARKADELAHELSKLNEIEAKKKEATATFSAAIKQTNTRIHELGDTVRTKSEYRQIECVEQRAFEQNLINIKRRDTGDVVRTRAMTAKERQEELGFGFTPELDADDDGVIEESESAPH